MRLRKLQFGGGLVAPGEGLVVLLVGDGLRLDQLLVAFMLGVRVAQRGCEAPDRRAGAGDLLGTVPVAALGQFGFRLRQFGAGKLQLGTVRRGVETGDHFSRLDPVAFVDQDFLNAPGYPETQCDLPGIHIPVQDQLFRRFRNGIPVINENSRRQYQQDGNGRYQLLLHTYLALSLSL